ncbi:MAG: ACT domain-containing protein [Candidatus Gastranaerophilaceae bacterium]
MTTSDNKIIVTVIGADKVGIIADVAAVLAECGVNIEDIKQSVIQNCFVMFMLVNSEKSELSFKEIKDKLTSTGERLKMEIWVQKKQIFDKMHSV